VNIKAVHKNIVTVASGSIVSQLIMLIFTPLLTRIYTPEAFGLYAVFFSALTIVAIFGSGRFEHAIVLPETREEAFVIVDIILALSFFVGLLLSCLIAFVYLLGIQGFINDFVQLDSNIFYFPILIVVSALNSGLTYLLLRDKQYLQSSIVVIVQAVVTVAVSVLAGYLQLRTNGLILGLIIGSSCSSGVLFYFTDYFKRQYFFDFKQMRQKITFYKNFPKYLLVSDFATASSQHLAPIVLTSFFSSFLVGNFSMAVRILRIPVLIVSNSMSAVFRNNFADDYRSSKELNGKFVKYLSRLSAYGVIFFSIFFFASPYLFEFVLGNQWSTSGKMAQALSVMVFFEFLSIPFTSIYHLLNKQDALMKFQLANVLFSLFMFILLGGSGFGFSIVLSAYICVNVLFNTIGLWYLYRLTQKMKLVQV
jgi:teichuronic acid exporter